MRVLHVNKYLYRRGGAEAYMLDVARLQAEAGHEIAFFAMAHPDNLDSQYAPFFPPRVELNPPPSGIADRAKAAGGIIFRPSALRGMTKVIEEFQPDVVHAHNIYHQLSPSILSATAAAGIGTVMTLHDYKLACPTYQFLDHGRICEACVSHKFFNAALRRCNNGSLMASTLSAIELTIHTALKSYGSIDSFICPSQFMLRKMTEGKVFPDRLVHVPHFCDFSNVVAADQPGEDLVFAGRLSPEKGVDVVIEAMAKVPAPTRLRIAGDGPSRRDLERLATSLDLSDRVQFLGRVTADRLHALIRAASVVVVPSRWYENQPMIVLEAFACGRPVVASNLGGLSEMIENGVTGHLVPHDDPAALAAVLAEVSADAQRCHAMGALARERAGAAFSVARHLASLDQLYVQAQLHKAVR